MCRNPRAICFHSTAILRTLPTAALVMNERGVYGMQEHLAQQCAAAAEMLLQQQQQQQASPHTIAVQTAPEEVSPDATAISQANLTSHCSR